MKWITVLLGLACVLQLSTAAKPNEDPNCDFWADEGECDANPTYMWKSCETACEKIDKERNVGVAASFYDLEAKDIHGKPISFEKYKDKVVVITNVATYCGRTNSHYRGLVKLHKHFEATGMVEILGFPCNQFGEQEPEKCEAIEKFATNKGVKFQMMDKIDVNGMDVSPVYKFLKKKTSVRNIHWNFDTYFIVDTAGSVEANTDVEPMDLVDEIQGKLDEYEKQEL
eukprot:CAMPEP_0118698160 /NCGR_PEP_ID=MMETSP0800-20121206/15022_1 /TAXON_ID=210618 ORGANISM="Striatella unipunctata, Strain CCMP2910" /NCGR_SAMPLE_ID=MMETSP0800 /ASSEMBLY_ACC=CAM_ASM_000638 /LENGTH=226 /DNA_ID=CAMNT_0006597901 /DNA_START=76 /DNA_END=759 /DNA_ORIENTATION=+